ncbi:MAG: ATP-dependent helicase [Lachnospiraceae bacterium]|nr:ATP-dependent helicase [Lachnospiraceae bacterium]
MQSPSSSQLKAIKHGKGPMLVMAGPGSGKSFVIIQRILNLIQEHKVYPQNILVISFSKASTLELKERFQKQIGNIKSNNNQSIENPIENNSINESKQVIFSTFHACFFQILKGTYHYTSHDIITEKQKRDILTTILLDPEYEIKSIAEKMEDYLQKISYYKNKGLKELQEKESVRFQKIYRAYNQEMHRQHKLDFEDMGLLCLQLFQNKPDILEKWQEKFQYILIDEFQDINMIQFRIIQLLAGKYRNLFVVGDDDQSIYGFRGSNPQIMLDFEKYYPDTEKVLLETNYRCSEPIVKEALSVIEQNKVRFQKEIRAVVNYAGEKSDGRRRTGSFANNGNIVYQGFENYHKEYSYIGEQIQSLVKEKKYNYSDIACIFRTNRDMNGLAEYFVRKKIPFVMKESCNSIFKHFIALDMIAYLSFFLEGRKRSYFIRIMNKPLRYIARNALSSLNSEIIVWKDLKEYYKSKGYIINNIEQLEKNDKWIQKLDLYGACFYIRKVMGYDNYLKEYVKEKRISWEESKEILDFIQESTRNMCSLEEWKTYIEEYEEAIKKTGEEKDGVHIITMHACKGLEYPIVVLPDCNEGKIPYKKAASPEAIEEERRMLYVAMTRAKTHLEMLYIEDEAKKHLQVSRFLIHNIKPDPKFLPVWKR